jgi:hypothetical protein
MFHVVSTSQLRTTLAQQIRTTRESIEDSAFTGPTFSRLLKMENAEIKEAVRTVSRVVELNSFGLPSSHARPHHAGQLD